MAIVYMIQNIINGNVYIGKTYNLNRRWNNHKYSSRHNRLASPYLYNAIIKYGIRNFKIETLESFETDEEAFEAEIWWIAYLKSLGATLYNISLGGEGSKGIKCSESAKKIIGKKNKLHAFKKRVRFENDFRHFR